jgi:hypothetical protein
MLHGLFYLETAVHVLGGTTTHHQERKQRYLQHMVFATLVTAICRYRGRGGTGLIVLWVAYATHTQFQLLCYLPHLLLLSVAIVEELELV